MKTFTFKNGISIPALGFGTWELIGEQATHSTEKALEIGYRYIDTADKYDNHKEVGQATADSGIAREDIFLTTKVWLTDLAPDDLKNSTKRFLEELQTDYLDLLLIHWPNHTVSLEGSLKAMDELKTEGIIRNIGVSNFSINHLKQCLKSGVEVVNCQVEIHPTFAQFELQKFCEYNEILVTAYSPFGRGADLNNETLKEIAQKYNKSVPQVIINWLVSRGVVTIPKATSEEHIRQNFESLDFELESSDIEKINRLDKGERILNPSWAEFDL